MTRVGVSVVVALAFAGCAARQPEPLRDESGTMRDMPAREVAAFNRGSEPDAEAYYERISAPSELNWDIPGSSCGTLVGEFLGRPSITCADLGAKETTWSQRDGVVGVRFFSPKISMFGATHADAEIGWRSVVRVESSPGSPARRARIHFAYFSFNRHAKFGDAIPDEFYNVQSILVKERIQAGETSTYWLAYDGFDRLLTSITATFDGLDSSMIGSSYYLPQVCIQCHGTSQRRGFLNFLDVDAWFDRTAPGDDFEGVAPVLPDAPAGPTSRAFLRIFDQIRILNEGIEEQNRKVGAPDFVIEAARSWNAKHGRARLLPPDRRGVGSRRDRTWDADDPIDAELLPMLNRYCYRCHSSRVFNVFDRRSVVRLKHRIERVVSDDGTEPPRMPRDRRLTPDTVERLVALTRQLR